MHGLHIKITLWKGEIPAQYIERMVEIVTHYLPNQSLMKNILHHHIDQADTIRLAWHENRIVGFSIASKLKKLTPFYPRQINVLFERMLYLEPDALYCGLGLRLMGATLRDLFGPLWPLKRFAVICRTQNPVVVKMMNTHNVTYPQYNRPLPDDIRQFSESLLPLLNAKALDDKCRLIGTLEAFTGMDYTDIWNRYLHHGKNKYEALILDSAFNIKEGRIINSGCFTYILAYSKPLHFIRYLFH